MKYKNYYAIFGVPGDAAQEEIKVAYRRLACKFRPDVSKETQAEERFKAACLHPKGRGISTWSCRWSCRTSWARRRRRYTAAWG